MIRLFAALGISERYRGPVLLVLGLVLLVLGTALLARCASLWVADERDEAVRLDRGDAVAEAANIVLGAERAATANQIERDAAFANSQEELKDVAREADKGAGVGPATSAVLERLRQQQDAGRSAGATR